MVMKERKTFVFVPSRTAEVIGLKGTLKWTQGEESFYFVYYSMCCFVCQTWNFLGYEANITSDLFTPPFNIPISCPMLFMLMNVVSHLFFNF